MTSVLGLIVARKGSRRLPGKNTRPLAGKPLIVWTIEAAKQSQRLTQIVCSTDDEVAMDICREHAVEVIARPEHLATDEATSEDVVLHVLDLIPCDLVCLLQPTSPLRLPQDIDACVDACFGGLPNNGCLTVRDVGKPVPNGAVYVTQPATLRAYRTFSAPATRCVRMPANRSVDIDTEADFELAERIASGKGIDWDG